MDASTQFIDTDRAYNDDEFTKIAGAVPKMMRDGQFLLWLKGEEADGKTPEAIKDEVCRRIDNYFKNKEKRRRVFNGKNTLSDIANIKDID